MRIGLALGGGGARGLAHIAMLEAFDELGIKPAMIIGCSAGSLIGAPYAAGMSAKDIREHAKSLLSRRTDMLRHVFKNTKMNPLTLMSFGGLNSLQLSASRLVEIAMPPGMPETFEQLSIPMEVVTTNYTTMQERIFSQGPFLPAVAASIAIPGIISGSVISGELHVDGGVTNPVPFNHLIGKVDKVIAIDVTGRPRADNPRPSNIEVAVGSLLIMFHQIARLRKEQNPPDAYIDVDVSRIGAADFFKFEEIMAAAEPAKRRLKSELAAIL